MQDYNVAGICIYQDATIGSNASASVTTDGNSWTRLGRCGSSNIQFIDLSEHNDAAELRIAWSGTPPLIYEIEEFRDTAATTDIKTFSINSDVPSWKSGEGCISVSGFSRLRSAEVYSPDGKVIRKTQLKGAKNYEISKSDLNDGIVIVKITREDGSVFTRKFIVKH